MIRSQRPSYSLCAGGFKVSLKEIEEYRTIVRRELEAGKYDWECACNGERWNIPKAAPSES